MVVLVHFQPQVYIKFGMEFLWLYRTRKFKLTAETGKTALCWEVGTPIHLVWIFKERTFSHIPSNDISNG